MNRFVLAAAIVLSSQSARADDGDGDVEVVVVPFESAGVSAEEATNYTNATVAVYTGLGRSAELAGVGSGEILTLSGCEASDNECLATIPSTLGAETVVFGTARIEGGKASVVLVVVGDGEKKREVLTLIGATKEERLERYQSDLRTTLSGQPVEELPVGLETDPPTEPPVAEVIAPPPQQRGSWDRRRVGRTPWIIAGAGAGSVAVGLTFLIIGNSKQSSIDDAPTDTVDDLDRLEDLEGQAKFFNTTGNILVVGGLAAGLVAGGLIFHQGRAPAESGVTVTPTAYRGGGGGISVTIGGW